MPRKNRNKQRNVIQKAYLHDAYFIIRIDLKERTMDPLGTSTMK